MGGNSEEATDDSGIGLPGAVGAVVKLTETTPGRALLGPMAKALGDYWGEVTEEKVNSWRAKRVSNAAAHVAKVQAKEGKPRAAHSEERERLQQKWLETAETVDPATQPEIAALWRGLLSRIMNGEPDTEELIAALKGLSTSDARKLLKFRNGSRFRDPFALTSLEKAGLVQRVPMFWNFFRGISSAFFATIAAATMAFAYAVIYDFPIIQQVTVLSGKFLAVTPVVLMGLIFATISLLIYANGRYVLTELGYRLQKSGREFI